MQMDEFLGLLKKRRSIRRFKPDPIPDGYVEKIVEAARWAMSGGNGQPWEFIIVKDKDTKAKIVELADKNDPLRWAMEKARIEEIRHPAWSKPPSGQSGFRDAPVFIVVCGDPRTWQATVVCGPYLRGDGSPEGTFIMNMANAIQNLHLAAAALGLGAQWVSVNSTWQTSLGLLLGVPEGFIIPVVVPVGYPAYEPSPPYRRELEEIMHFEKYDWSKYRSPEDIYQFVINLRQRTKPHYKSFRIGES
ncbi:MAG: nitroreductase family protein [Chloroflexi bacterium]|nr:nitroreductase family protein [Chloroflexota bacterium]